MYWENKSNHIGKRVSVFKADDSRLIIAFDDNTILEVADQEYTDGVRFLVADNDVNEFSGSILLNIELRDVEISQMDDENDQEIQFVIVTTEKGSFTLNYYNEHGGYYSGFSICVNEVNRFQIVSHGHTMSTAQSFAEAEKIAQQYLWGDAVYHKNIQIVDILSTLNT